MGDLLSIDVRKRANLEVARPRIEPTRAIYYGVFFRDFCGRPRIATDNLYADRKHAEVFIESRKREDLRAEYFIATMSVPASQEELANA